MVYDVNGNVICDFNGDGGDTYTDAECVTAFMAAVNKKAASIGMVNSSFTSPSGASGTAQTTAEDMALLVMIASCYKELAEVWSKDSYTIKPRNRAANITVTTTVKNATLEESYPILGGKTGSFVGHRALACLCEVDGKQVAGYIAGADTDDGRFAAMKELMDIAATVLSGGTPQVSVTNATSAVALEVPTYYTLNYEQKAPKSLFTQAGATKIVPASSAKLITAVTALDWISDVNNTFEFVQSDLVGGSGAVFMAGDVISFKDALFALMLPSSNMTAQAMARVIGRKVLNHKDV